MAANSAAMAGAMNDLVAAAKKEGEFTIIAVPHDWCGYGAIVEDFKKKYGLKLNELDPDRATRDVFVYFDNDRKVRAPFDARSLIEKVNRRLEK